MIQIVNKFIQDKKNSADEFSSFQMASESFSPSKQQPINDDWASFSSHIPQFQPPKQPEVSLNSADLDFLEMMGMSVPAKK